MLLVWAAAVVFEVVGGAAGAVVFLAPAAVVFVLAVVLSSAAVVLAVLLSDAADRAGAVPLLATVAGGGTGTLPFPVGSLAAMRTVPVAMVPASQHG